MTKPCPCGSGRDYGQCCGPLHQGAEAATAEALMRSRYTAFALGLDDYLTHSWHPDTRPQDCGSDHVKWVGLTIVNTDQGGPEDQHGEVDFRAQYLDSEQLGTLCERSRFGRHMGRWVYLDGVEGSGEMAISRRIGRNEPCPCGSGAKFKRCCAK